MVWIDTFKQGTYTIKKVIKRGCMVDLRIYNQIAFSKVNFGNTIDVRKKHTLSHTVSVQNLWLEKYSNNFTSEFYISNIVFYIKLNMIYSVSVKHNLNIELLD